MNANSSSPMPNRRKYHHSEYEDGQVDALMRYFKFENYGSLEWFLRSVRKER